MNSYYLFALFFILKWFSLIQISFVICERNVNGRRQYERLENDEFGMWTVPVASVISCAIQYNHTIRSHTLTPQTHT